MSAADLWIAQRLRVPLKSGANPVKARLQRPRCPDARKPAVDRPVPDPRPVVAERGRLRLGNERKVLPPSAGAKPMRRVGEKVRVIWIGWLGPGVATHPS